MAIGDRIYGMHPSKSDMGGAAGVPKGVSTTHVSGHAYYIESRNGKGAGDMGIRSDIPKSYEMHIYRNVSQRSR